MYDPTRHFTIRHSGFTVLGTSFSQGLLPKLALWGFSICFGISSHFYVNPVPLRDLFQCRKPPPLGVVIVGWFYQFCFFSLESRWRSHESGEKPPPLGVDCPIQAVPLFTRNICVEYKVYAKEYFLFRSPYRRTPKNTSIVRLSMAGCSEVVWWFMYLIYLYKIILGVPFCEEGITHLTWLL